MKLRGCKVIMRYSSAMLHRLKTIPLDFNIQLSNGFRDSLNQGFLEIDGCYLLKTEFDRPDENDDYRQKMLSVLKERIVEEGLMRCEFGYNEPFVTRYTDTHILENSIIFTDLLLKQWGKEHPDKKLLVGIIITEDDEMGQPLETTLMKILVERPDCYYFQNLEDRGSDMSELVANSFDDLDLVDQVKRLQSQFIK